MKFKCEKCGTRYTIGDEKVRNRVLKIRCKVCENIVTVRDPDAPLTADPTGSDTARASRGRLPSLAAAPIADEFPNDRTSVGDPLAPVSDVEWYCAPESGQRGPMPLERLRDLIRSGDVKSEDFVWNETMSDWVPASTVNVLGDLFRPKVPARLPAGPPPMPAAPPPSPVAAPSVASSRIASGRVASPASPPPVSLPPVPVSPDPVERSGGRDRAASAKSARRSLLMEEILGSAREPIASPAVSEPARGELDVDLLSLLGPMSTGSGTAVSEGPPTELMPSSRAPTRPVESDELAALMAAEMAAPPTAVSPALVDQLSAVKTRTADAGARKGGRGKTKAKAEDNFGFGDLHELPTALPASDVAVHVVHDVQSPRRSLPTGVLIALGAVLVVGGVALGIWLAPRGAGPAVAAPPPEPPSSAALVSAAPIAAPTAPPTAPPTQVAVPSAPATVVVAELSPSGVGGADGRPADPTEAPRGTTPKAPRTAAAGTSSAPAPASHTSAFAGLDAARGSDAPRVPTKAAARADLPPGLDQSEISAVIKRNIKAVQGCYQRQLKRDDTIADGRATIRFRISSDGRAQAVEMDRRFKGTVLEQCIVNTVGRWAFPEFEGDPIPVEFPVIFTATF